MLAKQLDKFHIHCSLIEALNLPDQRHANHFIKLCQTYPGFMTVHGFVANNLLYVSIGFMSLLSYHFPDVKRHCINHVEPTHDQLTTTFSQPPYEFSSFFPSYSK